MIIQNPASQNYEKVLQHIGLTESEAKLYLSALELGSANVVELSERADLSRQMVYLLLPGLQAKGLIQQTKHGSKVHYKALSPKLLRDLAKSITKQIEGIIPLLESRQAEHDAIPLLTVYENPVAMREWYVNFMKQAKQGDEILILSSSLLWHWYDLDSKFYDKYLRFCDRKGIRSRIILPDTKGAREYQAKIGSAVREPRYSSYLKGEPVEKWIWRDQVCYQTIRDKSTNLVVIESSAVAVTDRSLFEAMWKLSSKE